MFEGLIQVAGIKDLVEAELVYNAGANLIGFPLFLKDGREDLGVDKAKDIIRAVKSKIQSCLITYQQQSSEILQATEYLNLDVVQLHNDIEVVELQQLRASAPNLKIIKSLIVDDNLNQLKIQIESFSPYVDAFITDTFDSKTGQKGATGLVHDWNISKELVDCSSRPMILAGGLNCDNVRRGILEVSPAGVDVHTGVEDGDGNKDYSLVVRFVNEARIGFSHLV